MKTKILFPRREKDEGERELIHSYSIPLTLYRTLTGTLGGVLAAWK